MSRACGNARPGPFKDEPCGPPSEAEEGCRLNRMFALHVAVASAGLAASPALAQPQNQTNTGPQGASEPHEVLRDARIWSTFAGGADRVSIAPAGSTGPGVMLSSPRFVFDGDEDRSFVFYGQTAVAMTDELIIAIGYESDFFGVRLPEPPGTLGGDGTGQGGNTQQGGRDGTDDAVILPGTYQEPIGSDVVVAIDRVTGELRWVCEIPIALLDSWSAPTVDMARNSVLVATGTKLCALSLDNGQELWRTSLDNLVVNATPVVTYDRPGRDRAFITDHSFASGSNGHLFCVNVDEYHPTNNPYDPGELVWIVDLKGETSGNTPAYRDGMVYVSTASGGGNWDQGMIRAYPVGTNSPPQPAWVFEHTSAAGFFSGVAVTDTAVYASTYSFTGDQFSAQTVRLNRATGQRVWSVPTNRTDVVPVPFGDRFVLVSGGVPFSSQFPAFGSLPSLELIVETPFGSAARVWDTAIDTLDDNNNNGRWDPGEDFLSLGGWTIQPSVVDIDGKFYAYAGASPDPSGDDGFFGASPAFAVVDLGKMPTDAGFVVGWGQGAGASPAISGTELYSVGYNGVVAFGAPAMPVQRILAMWSAGTLPDFNADGIADLVDLNIAMEHASTP